MANCQFLSQRAKAHKTKLAAHRRKHLADQLPGQQRKGQCRYMGQGCAAWNPGMFERNLETNNGQIETI
jgi:hypothetical protein